MAPTVERDPSLVWNPLPEHGQQLGIQPIQWIVHTFVDSPSMDVDEMQDYFEHSTSLESHTILGWGEHQQVMDFDRRADANYMANRFQVGQTWCGAISTETEDDGQPTEKPWNEYQLRELIRFGTWLSRTFGIPPFPPATWNTPGMGWHCLYPDHWTNVKGKICPGHLRIAQFTGKVLPAIRLALEPQPPTPKDDDMRRIVKGDGVDVAAVEASKWWITDGILKRHVNDRTEAAGLVFNGLAEWDNGEAFVWPQALINDITTVPRASALA